MQIPPLQRTVVALLLYTSVPYPAFQTSGTPLDTALERSWKRPSATISPCHTAIPLGPDTFMLPIESYTQVFIIRIWLDEMAEGDKPALWRGRLIHVPSGQSHHFDDMDLLIGYLREYLQAINIDI